MLWFSALGWRCARALTIPKGAPIKRARGHRGMSRDVEGLGHTHDLQLAWKPESVLE